MASFTLKRLKPDLIHSTESEELGKALQNLKIKFWQSSDLVRRSGDLAPRSGDPCPRSTDPASCLVAWLLHPGVGRPDLEVGWPRQHLAG